MARRSSGFGGVGWRLGVSGVAIGLALSAGFGAQARAETLNEALVKAYQSNPQLNAGR
ncbi:MAG TPA: transporter, partial [Afipia sp.]|nr:transporter [Afipia sp.]